MNKKDKKYIQKLEEHKVSAKALVKYSLDRFDILIISLSSGGLVLSASIYENFKDADKNFINIGWIFFSAALIINLLSQITGYHANKLDIKCTNILIDEVKGEAEHDSHKKIDLRKEVFNKSTAFLNGLSFLSLTTAIVLIVLFINLNNNYMSDKDKNQSGNKGGQSGQNSSNGKGSSQERSSTTKEEWNKIDKKGQGTGDRPKR